MMESNRLHEVEVVLRMRNGYEGNPRYQRESVIVRASVPNGDPTNRGTIEYVMTLFDNIHCDQVAVILSRYRTGDLQ